MGLDHVDTFGGEHRVERPGELDVPVADQKPKHRGSLAQIDDQVADLLSGPLSGRVRRHTDDMYPSGRDTRPIEIAKRANAP